MPGESTQLGPFRGGLTNRIMDNALPEDEDVLVCENFIFDIYGNLVTRPAIITETVTLDSSELEVVLWETMPTAAGSADVTDILMVTSSTGTWISTGGAAFVKISNGYHPAATVGRRGNEVVLWIAKSPDATLGGYWSLGDTSITTLTNIPIAQAVIYYRNRVFFAGLQGGSEDWASSILAFSGTNPTVDADFTFFVVSENEPSPGFVTIAADDGQTINDAILYFDSILIFKDSRTYLYTNDGFVRRFQIQPVSNTVGAKNRFCAVILNDVCYVLHERYVHRFTGQSFQPISEKLTIKGSGAESLSTYGDTLIARRGSKCFVYNFYTEGWTEWISTRMFNYLVAKPSSFITDNFRYVGGLDNGVGKLVSIETEWNPTRTEDYTARIFTKNYLFGAVDRYKRLFGWGAHVKHVGVLRGAVDIHGEERVNGANPDSFSAPTSVVPSNYGQFFRFLKAYRFRQVAFGLELVTNGAVPSTVYTIVPKLRPAARNVQEVDTSV